jgi:lantibiotic transport system permease protein
MVRLLTVEWLKLRRSIVWLLVPVSPLAAALAGVVNSRSGETHDWEGLLSVMILAHALLFLPLLAGIYAALICRYEHAGGGWKLLVSLPVTRTRLYAAKFTVVMLLLALTQLLFLTALLLAGIILGYPASSIPWGTLLQSVVGGWIACLPLAALQLFVSVAFQSFAAPLAVNVIFTLPNMLIVNSERYGPYYPWCQPLLAMMPKGQENYGAFALPMESLLYAVLGSFLLFAAVGWGYFKRKSI